MGRSSQEMSCGAATADVSGLVAGVEIGVVTTEPGGVGEQLAAGVEL